MDHSSILLLEDDDNREDRAVKNELHVLGCIDGGGVLLDNWKYNLIVFQELSPEIVDPLPGWGKIIASVRI